jgi:hypothetical protein
MDKNKRKELQEDYKQIKTYMGAIQITNKANGKIFVDSFPNLKNKWMTLQMQLDMGRFANAHLQKDWKEWGSKLSPMRCLRRRKLTELTTCAGSLNNWKSGGWRNCSHMETEDIIRRLYHRSNLIISHLAAK